MRVLPIVLWLIFLCSISQAAVSDWEKFYTEPSATTYSVLSSQIAESLSGKYPKFEEPTYKDLNRPLSLAPLVQMLREGNPLAIAIGFEIYPLFCGTGDALESISVSLNDVLHLNPEAYLEALHKNITSHDSCLSHKVVAFTGERFVDELQLAYEEYGKRIDSLNKVTEPVLQNIKEQCISFLSKRRAYYKEIM